MEKKGVTAVVGLPEINVIFYFLFPFFGRKLTFSTSYYSFKPKENYLSFWSNMLL